MSNSKEKQSLEVTASNLLGLHVAFPHRRVTQDSPLLKVTLRDGRVINAYLQTTPRLSRRKRPGIRGIELYVVDVEKIFEGYIRRVTGDKVLAIHA